MPLVSDVSAMWIALNAFRRGGISYFPLSVPMRRHLYLRQGRLQRPLAAHIRTSWVGACHAVWTSPRATRFDPRGGFCASGRTTDSPAAAVGDTRHRESQTV